MNFHHADDDRDSRHTAAGPDGTRPAVALQQPGSPRVLRSADLMGNQREVLIQHALDTYRLRVTAQGKLILTK